MPLFVVIAGLSLIIFGWATNQGLDLEEINVNFAAATERWAHHEGWHHNQEPTQEPNSKPKTTKEKSENSDKPTPLPPDQNQEKLLDLRTMTDEKNSFGINSTEKILRQAGFKITREMRANGTINAIAELLKSQK